VQSPTMIRRGVRWKPRKIHSRRTSGYRRKRRLDPVQPGLTMTNRQRNMLACRGIWGKGTVCGLSRVERGALLPGLLSSRFDQRGQRLERFSRFEESVLCIAKVSVSMANDENCALARPGLTWSNLAASGRLSALTSRHRAR